MLPLGSFANFNLMAKKLKPNTPSYLPKKKTWHARLQTFD
ncbi:MAG: hypothetical protein Rsou_1731 [Candidatus Ruthia sp. Asou_11_S2]|nr:hypothetical protein [Candidatus Ruthia sp. Asou_11_S2]